MTRQGIGLRKQLSLSRLEVLTLRWRFGLVAMAFGLPFLAYIVWSASHQSTIEAERARDRARSNAMLLASRFADHVDQVDRLLATISQSITPHREDPAAISELLQSMRSYVPKSIDNLGVWSLTGDSVASLDRRSATRVVNVADRLFFRETVARRDLAIEGPIRSRATGAQIIQCGRPIFDSRGEVAGVLSMSIRSRDLIDQLDPEASISSHALVTIINKQGTIAARSAESDLWIGKQVGDLEENTAAFANRTGTREETGTDGQRRLSGYSVVAQRPWIVVVTYPLDEFTGPVAYRLLRSLCIGVAILALALLVADRMAAWTTRPLKQLAADNERLGGGDLSHRSTVVSGREIATVATSFNRMAAAIENRERALATSLTQLRAIADNVPEQITYIDRDGRYRFVNAYRGPFESATPDDIIGKTIREVRGQEVYQALLPAFQRAMEGESFSYERSMVLDGRPYYFFVTYIPDFDTDRTVKGVYAFTQDITIRKTAELLRIETEKRLVTITDNLPAMICYVDENRCFRFANKAWEKWFLLPLDKIIGQPFDRMMAPALAAQYDYWFLRAMQGEPLDYEVEIPSPDHGPRWLRCSFIPDIDEATGKVSGVYGVLHNVTKAKEAEQRLTRLAQFDTLTGLANRHQFNETFDRVLRQNDREATPLALMFLDIDHFKQVNDRYGHGGGDMLLKEFAQRLADCIRPTDTVARLAGDEFVVLLEGMHSDEEPQFVARKIIAAVEKPFVLDEQSLHVTASIGIAMRERPGEAASALMKRADEALYEAKRSGRNTFRMAS